MVGSDRNTVQGFINDMISERSNTDAPTLVEYNNKTTAASKLGKTKPVVVHENNNGNTKFVDTGLNPTAPLVPTLWKKREDGFMDRLISMMCRMIIPIHLQKRMNRGSHTRSQVTTAFLNSPKPNTTGDQKQDS